MISKIIAFLLMLSAFNEMNKAKEKRDIYDIVYWGILTAISIMVMGWVR